MLNKKFYISLSFLSLLSVLVWAEKPDAALDSLDACLNRKHLYDQAKQARIDSLQSLFTLPYQYIDNQRLFDLCNHLYNEYRSYRYDSAYAYAERMYRLACTLGNADQIASAQVKQCFNFLSTGLFKECSDLLQSIDLRECTTSTQADFYQVQARFYYDLADYNNDPASRTAYHQEGNRIIEKALERLPAGSHQRSMAEGLKYMKDGNADQAIRTFRELAASGQCSENDYAIATSSLAYLLDQQGYREEAKACLVQAAMADLRSSTKETTALCNLARMLYEEGDIARATRYVHHALDDAYAFNARQRLLEIGQILPIIEKERMDMLREQNRWAKMFSLSLSVAFVGLAVAIFVSWTQLRRLKKAQAQIQGMNEHLLEANKIKEEYIGDFFSLSSEYIDKIENYQRYVKRRVMDNQHDELIKVPKQFSPLKERENLYARFDQIFLKIFPDFVDNFNALLRPGERICLKEGELLNTDLRIYALIRLGISDNDRIARFLGYSVNTIYTYKTRTKAKARYPDKSFKEQVLAIKPSY